MAATSNSARKRAKTRAVKEVARYLGNTPAVCRASYIDPRVFDRFDGGLTISGALPELMEDTAAWPDVQQAVEEAVLDLIANDSRVGGRRAGTRASRGTRRGRRLSSFPAGRAGNERRMTEVPSDAPPSTEVPAPAPPEQPQPEPPDAPQPDPKGPETPDED